MTTIEKDNNNSFNSNFGEKLLLDELMSSSNNNEQTNISNHTVVARALKKPQYDNIYQLTTNNICNKHKKCFRQKVITRNEGKGGSSYFC